jgi:SHS family lactate transporter-like MFS transporter
LFHFDSPKFTFNSLAIAAPRSNDPPDTTSYELAAFTSLGVDLMAIAALSGWTSEQKHVVAASFLGWSLDAFDFFLLVFVLKDIAAEFQTDISDVTLAILLTLAMRPIGAFIFGRAADRWGRRPVLMIDILLYSILEFASGFAPSLTVLIILRALYGVAMGGEWGVGASLTMETIPPHARGFVSGLLQSGYPAGYFMASIVYGVLFPYIGWRGMFMVGVIPALLVLYIRRNVPESPSWSKEAAVERGSTLTVLKSNWRLGIYAVVLMTAFNFFSHGTQDLYPTFLQVEHELSPHVVGIIAVIYNIGAICGGILFGTLSERFGRRRCIIIAALLSLPVIPLWAFSDSPALLAIGAFLMQFTVQGAWGGGARTLERVVARHRARDVSRIRLSTGQPAGVRERNTSGRRRFTFRRQLWARARGRSGFGRGHHRSTDGRWHRSQRDRLRQGESCRIVSRPTIDRWRKIHGDGME